MSTLYLDRDGVQPVKIKARAHKNMALVKLEGVDTVAEAEALRGRILYLHRDDVKLEPGRYFIQDLLGLRIVDADTGRALWRAHRRQRHGCQRRLPMRYRDGREILIPAIPQVIAQIDTDGGVLRLRPMPGLLDDEI